MEETGRRAAGSERETSEGLRHPRTPLDGLSALEWSGEEWSAGWGGVGRGEAGGAVAWLLSRLRSCVMGRVTPCLT